MRAHSIVRVAVSLAVAALLGRELVESVRRTAVRARDAWHLRGESAFGARVRTEGAYAEGIERIRAAIPRNAEYLIVEGKPEDGAHFFVLYDLEPRRALYLGGATASVDALRRAAIPGPRPRWVVVSYGATDSPSLVASEAFFGEKR